ncbi:MAG: nucleotide exchange factor GrpE [Bacteroidota bacterium]|jgi:molecular chaperone GrpE
MSKRKNNKMEDNAAEQANVNEEQQGLETENKSSNDANSSSTEPSNDFEDKIKEQEDKFLRLYAEFENYRKRSSREKAEYLTGASREMIMAMLPILDDFERAIKNNDQVTDVAILKEGFQLIYTKLGQILEAKGLKPIDALNEPFDYNLHEAIANVPVEDEALKGKVIDQVEKGYYLNDKVIRFSKVAVGQ